jgi:predicted CoA-binding protein
VSAGTIAVVGASKRRAKFGNKCVRAYQSAGWTVFPVNPHEEEIEGLAVLHSLREVPVALDRISLYLPPHRTRELLPELAEMGDPQVWFNPGSADRRLLEAATRAGLDVHDGCSIVDIGRSPAEFP